ncbi:RNA 2',3'-cyclic phosphodiesterase [Vibrio ponticus]|uniref:RNA 2',3'-cyclic phosphodiesterase n=1 Tax=Vibrio ponticus TaxID=265668 RepID=A0A3N3DTG4_9VIBR|nr:RNA 2',3'-cyclic phosphodiesterase [Vibrio ponticus]ROV57801.1 RNA 2',3'-cyclic phosphodiesterase [Vibrio ponticus]
MRVFYALTFTPSSRQAITHLQQKLAAVAKRNQMVDCDNFHITLEFVGEISQDDLERYANVIEQLHVENRYVEVTSIGAFGRGKEKLIWLAASQETWLMELQQQLAKQLAKLGFEPETRGYIPHITLARHTQLDGHIEQLTMVPQQLQLDTVALMESRRDGKKLRYIPLKKLNL